VADLQLRLPVHESPGTAPGVGSPLPAVTPRPHPPSACTPRPFSRLFKRRVRAGQHRLRVSGTAGEHSCLFATAAAQRRQRVAHVYVMVYRPVRGGLCRFVRRSGALTRPRSCRRPVEFLASGRRRWRLRLHISLRPGPYLVRSDAVDGNHRHQRHTGRSVKWVRVPGTPRRVPRAAADFVG
jgi:hypothetical protein